MSSPATTIISDPDAVSHSSNSIFPKTSVPIMNNRSRSRGSNIDNADAFLSLHVAASFSYEIPPTDTETYNSMKDAIRKRLKKNSSENSSYQAVRRRRMLNNDAVYKKLKHDANKSTQIAEQCREHLDKCNMAHEDANRNLKLIEKQNEQKLKEFRHLVLENRKRRKMEREKRIADFRSELNSQKNVKEDSKLIVDKTDESGDFKDGEQLHKRLSIKNKFGIISAQEEKSNTLSNSIDHNESSAKVSLTKEKTKQSDVCADLGNNKSNDSDPSSTSDDIKHSIIKAEPLQSELKNIELVELQSEMDTLNQTKSQMIWLLKQVITAERERKEEKKYKKASKNLMKDSGKSERYADVKSAKRKRDESSSDGATISKKDNVNKSLIFSDSSPSVLCVGGGSTEKKKKKKKGINRLN